MKNPQLKKTKAGFFQYSPLPSKKELSDYYAKQYFQAAHGSYTPSYTKEETAYFRLKADLIYKECGRLRGTKKKNFFDIGCGEGWVMDRFKKSGSTVLGIDFSQYGIAHHNPHVLPDFKQGDIYTLLDSVIAQKETFDVLLLANVIEHVVDPAALLKKIKKVMATKALLAVVAPNDFSPLHEHLLKHKYIDRKFWLAYPDHLSYFNKENMTKFLAKNGFKVESIVADNPIDLNLMNDNSNYIKKRSKGKKTHYFRVRTDNFLASIDVDKLLDIYRILGSMGVGRDLTYYCSLK